MDQRALLNLLTTRVSATLSIFHRNNVMEDKNKAKLYVFNSLAYLYKSK